jgi:hypothetical protein
MALGKRKPESNGSQQELFECTEAFTCDLADGTPVVVNAGELFSGDHELIARYGHAFFQPAGRPTWEKTRVQQGREAARGG